MKKICFILGFIGLLTSCTTVGTLSYDRLQAADFNYPETIRRVGVVNHIPPSGWVETSSPDVLEGNGKVMAESFAQAVAATDYFDQVVLCDSSLFVPDASEGLTGVQVDSLMQDLGVDMLFSLNRVQIQLKENSSFVPGLSVPVSVIDAVITPVIQVYASGRHAPLFTLSKSDSIYWEVTPSLNLEQVITESSEFAATIPMKYLLPSWEEINRYFYNGGDVNMRDAAVSVQEGDWESAFQLWEQTFRQKKGAAKMRAAYNLALYYEMHDDFEQARFYLSEALKLAKDGSAEKGMMEFYQVQLNSLAEKNGKLKMQMRRFENNF
ncbi:MAG: tetratricopeptide repeat protein [Bacteroides sp.]|nr:tetratricopeptide repeat protein [Bacteroides sp.]